ncbi:MAG TPA: hypothetical protein VHT91_19890 [Kofleriaceae bacterium]|jgi:hypothetical protein|nr:hypothetical protein [Kofleriaceae bacterium]
MAPCDREQHALRRARRAYQRAHLLAALRGAVLAGGLAAIAYGLHRMSSASWLAGACLAATLAGLGWRGGAWQRGALAGMIAGLPPLIAPTLVLAASSGWHCAMCDQSPTVPCLVTCLATSALVGLAVGHRAVSDASPRRFAIAAITSAALTGLLGCGTTGLGGAAGVVLGLVAGGVTGWIAATRAAHA